MVYLFSKCSGVKWKGRMVVCSLLPPRHDCGVLLKPSCIEFYQHMPVFSSSHVHLYFLCTYRTWYYLSSKLGAISQSLVYAGWLQCVQSDSMLALRRTGLVVSSIWEGTARHSPCLPCASALLCTLCCCCTRWTPKREWNGRFGAQVAENLSFRSRPL